MFSTAWMLTTVPCVYHPPPGLADTLPPAEGLAEVVSSYSVTQFHVIDEFWFNVKLTLVPVPLAGTSPVPVHPVHLYRAPEPALTGDATEQVTVDP